MTNPTSKISFGNVSFRNEQIKEKSDYKTENGKQRYSVTFKTGQKIDYPEQVKDHAFVDSNTKDNVNHMVAVNIDNATIYGNPNKSDIISLEDTSSNNNVILDNDKKRLVDYVLPKKYQREQKDMFFMGPGTKNNTVKTGEKDFGYIQAPNGSFINVEGAGVSDQNTQIGGLF